MQDLMSMVTQEHTADNSTSILCKVQGPFDEHTLSAAEEAAYSHVIFCAGGIGATAVLPMLMRAAMRRAEPKPGETASSTCLT